MSDSNTLSKAITETKSKIDLITGHLETINNSFVEIEKIVSTIVKTPK